MAGHAVEVVDSVWLGDAQAARDMAFLGQADITAVINLSGFKDEPIEDVYSVDFILYDHETMPGEIDMVTSKINRIADHLNNLRVGQHRVLVYCKEGVNRSPVVVGFYLIKHLAWAAEAVIRHLETCHIMRSGKGLVDARAQFESEEAEARSGLECGVLPKPICRSLTNMSYRRILRTSAASQN